MNAIVDHGKNRGFNVLGFATYRRVCIYEGKFFKTIW